MSGICTLAHITRLEKHPNADRLQVATVLGERVIVGLDAKVEDRVLYFDCDVQLSQEFCEKNDLIARYDATGTKIGGGYFDEKRRVRAQSFRGIKSQGFVCGLNYLIYCKGHEILETAPLGYQFTAINGTEICNRYVIPVRQSSTPGKQKVVRKAQVPTFLEHVDTDHLRYHLNQHVSIGDRIYVTAKAHGTSGRLHRGINRTPYKNKWLNKVAWLLKPRYEHWVGSRRVIKGTTEAYQNRHFLSQRLPFLAFLFPDRGKTRGYYSDESFRFDDVQDIKLHKGETIYYEHVGFISPYQPIMPSVELKKLPKEIQKQYKANTDEANKLFFKYGCFPYQRKLLVYRITWTNEDGEVYEVPWSLVKKRCEQLQLTHVHEFMMYTVGHETYKDHMTFADVLPDFSEFVERPEPLDPSHYMEGVVFRVERENGSTHFWKFKSHTFLVGEGLVKDSGQTDIEEQQSQEVV